MKNLFPLFTAVMASCICFTACQEDDVSPLSTGEETNSADNVIMFSPDALPVLSDTSLFDFFLMENTLLEDGLHPYSRNKSIDDDILSDKWRYFQNVPIIDGGYAMVGGYAYKTFIIGDQRWFLEDFKDRGLAESCNNVWEQKVFGAAPSPFASLDTALYFYFDATFLANGLTSTMDFNAPPELHPTTAWKLPNTYDMLHLWCMLNYEQSKVAEIFYEEKHKGIVIAECVSSPKPHMETVGMCYPDYSFFWIENDNPKVHYTLNGFRKSDGKCAGFNPGYLPPQYLYAPFRLMQYITPIDTIPQD